MQSYSAVKKLKIYQFIRGQDGHIGFQIGLINKTLVEHVEQLLPVKFRPFRLLVSEKSKM